MAISRAVFGWLEKSDFDAIENDWLEHLAEDDSDLDYLAGVARALAGQGEEERARFLLQLADDQLTEAERWQDRLDLLRRAGPLLLPPEELHPAILATIEKLYGGHSQLGGLIEAVGLHRAPHDIPKTWEKVDRLAALAVFDVGSVVAMENRGAGRVTEVNLALQSFKVDFERFPNLTVGFKGAPKLLTALAPDHVLRKKLEAPDALRALAASDPPELLRQVLTSYDRPLTAAEVRDALAGIVDEKSWAGFWAAARRHPQVVAGTKGRQSYRWAESSAEALEVVWRAFERAQPRKKIELLRRDGGRSEDLRRRMAQSLARTAAAGDDPGLAWEIWFALERSGGAPEDVPWSPEALLAEVDPVKLFAGVEDRLLRERGYAMLRERREDWPRVYLTLLSKEEDPRALDLLYEGLRQQQPEELGRFVDGLFSQPHKTPAAFVWIAERAAEDEPLRARNPLRLAQQILAAPTRDELAPFKSRIKPLVESGGTLPRLLSHLTPEQAEKVEEAIQRAPWLEAYQREQLINALYLRFPDLHQETELPLYALPGSIEAKRRELHELATRELPANRKAIEEARAMGDLRENFEYKAARQRHEYLSARAHQLERDLARVQPIAGEVDTSEIRIGTRARLTADGGDERALSILGPWESDPENGVISYQTDLAQELIGKKPGDEVEIEGRSFRVDGIERWG